ncbi:MAG: ABC transporter permease [Gaiellaceae bacterium]
MTARGQASDRAALIARLGGERSLLRAYRATAEVFRRDALARAGLLIYGVFILVAIFAPLIAPYGPQQVIQEDGFWLANEPPSSRFLLGTTNLGRDIFSQLVYGSRTALLVGFSAAVAVALIGTLVGLVAGYYGRWVDALLMRTADVAFGIPFLPLVIVLVAVLRPSIWNVVGAIALLLWSSAARVIRSQVLVVKEKAFVVAARASGAGDLRLIFTHIAPSVLPLSFLYGSVAIGWAILTEASISFLGFGDPNNISWGFVLQDAFVSQALSRNAYHWFLPPGALIMLTVMAGFFIGRGYEEILFPRLRRS